MSVTDERSGATGLAGAPGTTSGGEPPGSDGRPSPRRRHMPPRAIPPWVQLTVVAVVVLVAFLVWWFAGLRHDVRELSAKVDAIAEQGGFVLPTPESDDEVIVTLPPEQPPADAETARRKINDAVTAVFTPTSPAEVRAPSIDDPGDRAARLAAVSAGPGCADATLRVGGNRFVDPDRATSSIHFEVPQVPIADGYPFEIEVVRVGDDWKVSAASVDGVVGMASGFCG